MNIVRMQNRLVRFLSGRDQPGASAVRCNPSTKPTLGEYETEFGGFRYKAEAFLGFVCRVS
jgi:hypothetical protein